MLDTHTKFTATLFLIIFSKWLDYVLSLSTYNFTCKAVLHRMVVHFKAQRFEQDVRVVLKYAHMYMYEILLESYFLCDTNTRLVDYVNATGVHRLLTNLGTNPENKLYRRKMNCMNLDLALLIVSV